MNQSPESDSFMASDLSLTEQEFIPAENKKINKTLVKNFMINGLKGFLFSWITKTPAAAPMNPALSPNTALTTFVLSAGTGQIWYLEFCSLNRK